MKTTLFAGLILIPLAAPHAAEAASAHLATPEALKHPLMKWADNTRLGLPHSKDPSVIRFGSHYLMYFSLPPFAKDLAPANAPRGWSIGIAQSTNLLEWTKVGELWPEQECDQKGLCAPGARVLNSKVHLFYQTYGNFPKDAICHAVSDDGVHFQRDESNPVFHPTGDWNNGRAIDAEVVTDGDRLLLYFVTRDPSGNSQMLGVAAAPLTSDFSRKTWTQLCDKPILRPELPWETHCIEAPTVTRRGDAFVMFYAGGFNNDPQQIGVATSRDGVNWTRLSDAPLLPNGAPGEWNASESGHPGYFADDNGRSYLFFQGNNDHGKSWLLACVELGWDGSTPRLIESGTHSDAADSDMKAANNFDTTGFDFQVADGPVKPTAQSLGENYQCPEWFRDAKFGIYMHWGLNSVAGFDGHYGRYLYTQQEPEAARQDRETKRPAMSGYKPGRESVYQYHLKHFGHPSQFGYKDLIPRWKADKFDAAALAALYKECGARYVGVMAVHHDNFDLYDSTWQPWNSYRMGPRIDIVGEWKRACAREHLRFAISSHLSNGFHEHAFYQGETDATGPLKGVPYDTTDPKNEGLYGKRTPDRLRRLNPEFAQSWYRRTKELIDKYNPDLLYLDGGLPNGDYGLNLAAHFYNHDLAVNGKREGVFTIKRTSPAGFTLDVESAGIGQGMTKPWQVDTSINPGWFYLGAEVSEAEAGDDAGMSASGVLRQGPDRVRLTAGQVIRNLADIVSKNGNMMLNVGLRPDGSLPETYRHELLEIGRWLKRNGEAVYGTRPFAVFGEGPFELPKTGHFDDNEYHFTAADVRFTQSKDGRTLYAILLGWPGDGANVTIKSLGSGAVGAVKSVSMLATGEPLVWRQDPGGLHVTMPGTAVSDYAYVLKLMGLK